MKEFCCGIKLFGGAEKWMPVRANPGDSGFDLRARAYRNECMHTGITNVIPLSEKSFYLGRESRVLVFTGVFLEMPMGLEAQIRSRSGLALKSGICVLNSPGTIDSCYRNEIGVILQNNSSTQFEIKEGDRIAQMVFAEIPVTSFTVVDELGNSERGLGGFGSTGVK
jgi:dUTP pyrophosphatase